MINEVKQALEEAVQRGVKVCLLLDSVGSNAFLKSPVCKEMRAKGIEITEATTCKFIPDVLQPN